MRRRRRKPEPQLLKDCSSLSEELINLHQLGVDGNKAAVQKVYNSLTKFCGQNPNDNLAKAYLGSVTTLMGRDAIDPQERLRYAMQGCKIMDQAVANAQNDIRIRSLRAFVCLKLPESFFHRTKTAIQDFSYLISLYEKGNSVIPEEFYFELLFNLGIAYKNIEQPAKAETVWKHLLSLTHDPQYTKLVKKAGGSNIKNYRSTIEATTDEVKSENSLKKNENNDFQIALSMHKRAQEGNKKSLENAVGYFEKAIKENNQDAIITALYADILSLVAIYTDDAQEMFNNAYQAIVQFSNSLSNDPDNISIRKLRAYSSLRLPEAFFQETKTAIEDLKFLATAYENDQAIFSQATYFKILDDLGKAYYKINMDKEAKGIWDKLHASGGVTKYTAEQTQDAKVGDYLEVLFQEDIADIFEEAIRLHDLGAKGNKQAAMIAKEVLEKIYRCNPDNSLAQTYYGSSLAIVAMNTIESEQMINIATQAIANIEQAMAKDCHNPQIRILRANVFNSLLEPFFHLRKKVITDLKFVIDEYEKSNEAITEDLYWKTLYDLSLCYSKSDDSIAAEKIWDKIVSERPDSDYSKLIQGRKEGTGYEYPL